MPAKSPARLVLFKGLLASEARQAVGEAAVVKVAPTWVHVVNAPGVVHMCPGGPACPQPAPAGPWCTALAALAAGASFGSLL